MPVKPLLVAFVALMPFGGGAAASEACPGLSPETPVVRLAGLDAAGDPVLADGRALRLIGLAPRQDGAERARFASGIQRWAGQELKLVVLAGPDRWGRLPARLLAPGVVPGSAPEDLAAALLRSGAASAMPEAAHPGCHDGLEAGQTVSAKAGGGAIDGHDIAALKAQEGRFILLEGRIASVGERSQRTYFNFSRRRGEAASIVLSRKLWRDLKDAGWTAAGLSGKRLRARGVLSGQDGLLLEVSSKLALELVD
jgi:hypothetical protein